MRLTVALLLAAVLPSWASPADYAAALASGKSVPGIARGLCGRILRGHDFRRLTDDPQRKLVLVMGEDGLQKLPGKSTQQMLELVGYTPEYIQRKTAEGCEFKLVVFPERGLAAPATWENTVRLVGEAYPTIAPRLAAQLEGLRTTPFAQLDRDFAAIDTRGPQDPQFTTLERYRDGPADLVSARAFLYFTVHLRDLFAGDGYTRTPDSQRGLSEYMLLDRPLAELGEHVLIDLPRP